MEVKNEDKDFELKKENIVQNEEDVQKEVSDKSFKTFEEILETFEIDTFNKGGSITDYEARAESIVNNMFGVKTPDKVTQLESNINKKIDSNFCDVVDAIRLENNRAVSEFTNTYDKVKKESEDKKKENKKRKLRRTILDFALAFIVCFIIWSNDSIRTRVAIVATAFKDMAIDIIENNEVSSNKLLHDIGIKLNDINAIYFDENGNEITKEEYYERLNGTAEQE